MAFWSKEDILALKESTDTELKKAAGKDGKGTVPNSFWETYSAFANTDGGDIFLGIEELEDKSLKITGIADPAKIKQELFNNANNRQKVSANLLHNDSIETIDIDGKQVLRVCIARAPRVLRPVYLGANPLTGSYRRLNEGDVALTEQEAKRIRTSLPSILPVWVMPSASSFGLPACSRATP